MIDAELARFGPAPPWPQPQPAAARPASAASTPSSLLDEVLADFPMPPSPFHQVPCASPEHNTPPTSLDAVFGCEPSLDTVLGFDPVWKLPAVTATAAAAAPVPMALDDLALVPSL